MNHRFQVIFVRGIARISMRTIEIASRIIRGPWVKSIRDIIDLRRISEPFGFREDDILLTSTIRSRNKAISSNGVSKQQN